MQHNAPHTSAAFEGYYSKFDLPSGAHICLVICKVKNGKTRPKMLTFTYIPQDVSKTFQHECFPDSISMTKLGSDNAFELRIPGIGYVKWRGDSATEYDLKCDEFTLSGKTTSRTPWSKTTSTPESWLVHLPLPLHWHVHTLASSCDFSLSIPGHDVPHSDRHGTAQVHQEKNWAASFPKAHMWVQARDGDRGICLAGGQILGLDAFLLGYRGKKYNIDFRPPFATMVAGWSPFMSYTSDWDSKNFSLSVQSFRQKVVVEASAPIGTWFSMPAPFPEGHRPNMVCESFQATVRVKVYESGWVGAWRLVEEALFEGGSLEFGAEFYPAAGSEKKFH
nr:hypothetical protein B0A51_02909 [Rachicladosporium sp. CCFEE 5018]